jgi:hypothetical protein
VLSHFSFPLDDFQVTKLQKNRKKYPFLVSISCLAESENNSYYYASAIPLQGEKGCNSKQCWHLDSKLSEITGKFGQKQDEDFPDSWII